MRDDLRLILEAAVEAIDPSRLVAGVLRDGSLDVARTAPVTVVAAGKGAWPMTRAFASEAGVKVEAGLVAGPRGARAELPPPFEAFECGHPVPDAGSERAGRRALALADRASTLVVLLSGGASAMLAVPVEGVTLEDKARATRGLLQAGVSIDEMNCVRKHLSGIKGGQLAASARESLTLAISDVHGPVPDDPSVIGSGPTAADPTTYAQALDVLHRARAGGATAMPPAVVRRLERGVRGEVAETPKPGDPRLARSRYRIVGNRMTAMQGAAGAAHRLGYAVHVVDGATAGDARLAGDRFARTASLAGRGEAARVCVIASGETTVRVGGGGRGGRNQEFALGMASVLAGDAGTARAAAAASVGTDGIDGPTDAAGALVDSSTLARAARCGLDPDDALARNDTYPFFQRLGDLIVWGPTGTNVGDVHVFVRW